jgi:hypothetical protein
MTMPIAQGPVDGRVGRRPWWWKLNPWRALANRERAYAEALSDLQEAGVEIYRLKKIAAHVPATTYIAAKEAAGYGERIRCMS